MTRWTGNSEMERTLILIKPDGVKRGLIGEIIRIFEENGLTVERLKLDRLDDKRVQEFYYSHRGKDFYHDLLEYMSSGDIVAIVFTGDGAIERARKIIGDTNPAVAHSGTIRAKFGLTTRRNTVHASDCADSFNKEIKVIFGDNQI